MVRFRVLSANDDCSVGLFFPVSRFDSPRHDPSNVFTLSKKKAAVFPQHILSFMRQHNHTPEREGSSLSGAVEPIAGCGGTLARWNDQKGLPRNRMVNWSQESI